MRHQPPFANPTKSLDQTGKNRKSRAVLREIEAGTTVDCVYCGERIKFRARLKLRQVICNIYYRGVWRRVEHFHAECYEAAGSPHGVPEPAPNRRTSGHPKQSISAS